MKETREQKFKRLAEARVNRILHILHLLGNLSGANYSWDKKDVHKIFNEITNATELAKIRFNKGSFTKFSLDILKVEEKLAKPVGKKVKILNAPAKKLSIDRCDNCFENRPTQTYRGLNLCKRDFRKRKMIYKIRKANGKKKSFVK